MSGGVRREGGEGVGGGGVRGMGGLEGWLEGI